MEPPWEGGTKVCINGPGHRTKMAAMPIYGKNLKKSSSEPAVTGGNLINLAAIEKTKPKNITELQYCTGMSRREIKKIKLKKISFIFFFSISKKLGREGL